MSEYKPVGLKSNFFFNGVVILGFICTVAVLLGTGYWLISSIIYFLESLVQ